MAYYRPRYRADREYESPLHQYRLEARLTYKDLEKAAKVNSNVIRGFATGAVSPVHETTGRAKESAKRIAQTLGVDLEDLFPRYFCKMFAADYLTKEQQEDLTPLGRFTLEGTMDPEDLTSRRETMLWLGKHFIKLQRRSQRVMIKWLGGQTLQEIGSFYGLTPERIRQVFYRGVRDLRIHLQKSKEYREEYENDPRG